MTDTLLTGQTVVTSACNSISGIQTGVRGYAEAASIAFNDAYDTLRRKLSCQGIVINHNVDCLIDMAVDAYVDVKDSSTQEKVTYVTETVDHFITLLPTRSTTTVSGTNVNFSWAVEFLTST